MWKCSKYGKEFKHTNQDHYCGKTDTIDEYIAEQPNQVQPILNKIRATIREAAPDATEKNIMANADVLAGREPYSFRRV